MLSGVAQRQPKGMRVIAGVLLMAGVFLMGFALVLQYAGSWGVPYFGFTSPRGSPCKNTLTGHTCTPLTLADVEFHGDVDLPDDTRVLSGRYSATHDYQLEATLRVPRKSSAAALTALTEAFGGCQRGHPSPLPSQGLTNLCVLSNDAAVTGSGDVSSRLYLIGTGVRRDGSRDIALPIKSR